MTLNLDLHDQKTQSFNQQGTDLIQLAKQLNSLEVKLNKLERKIKVYDEKIDEMEQCSRSNCLIFHGVKYNPKTNYGEFINELTILLNDKLNLSFEISNDDVDIAHLLPPNKKNKR